MKKFIQSLVLGLVLTLPAISEARHPHHVRHWHYPHHHHMHYHRPNWVAPLVVGTLVGAAIYTNRVEAQQPVFVEPVIQQLPIPPVGYQWQQFYDTNCSCNRWALFAIQQQ